MLRPAVLLLLLPMWVVAAAPPIRTGVDQHGDPLPRGAVARLGTLRLRHALTWGSAHAQLDFSPDGKTMLSRAEVGLKMHDLTTGTSSDWIPEITGVRAIRLLPGGKTLATARSERSRVPGKFHQVWTIQYWNWPKGTPQGEVELAKEDGLAPTAMAEFSPDGKVIVCWGHSSAPSLFDTQTGKLLHKLNVKSSGVTILAFTRDSKRFVFVSSSSLHLFDTISGNQLRERIFKSQGLPPFVTYPFPAISPDGRLLAVSAYRDLLLLELPTLRLLAKREGLRGPTCFSPDGVQLACSGSKAIHLLDSKSLKTIRIFEPHDEMRGTYALRFLPDGKRLVLGGEYALSLWDPVRGKRLTPPAGHLSVVHRLEFSPDSRRLASGGQDGFAYVWDVPTGRICHAFSGHYFCAAGLAFSPDGRLLATGDGQPTYGNDGREAQIRLFDLHSGRQLRQFTGHLNGVQSLRFSPDGKTLATGGGDDRIRFWDVASGKRLGQARHLLQVQPVAFLDGGKSLLVHQQNGAWRTVDTSTFSIRDHVAGTDRYNSHAPVYLPAQGEVAAVQSGQVVRYRLSDGKQTHTVLVKGNDMGFQVAALSRDGGLLAVPAVLRSRSDIDLWDLRIGKIISTLKGHTNYIGKLAFSADGRWLASGGYDTTILLWDVTQLRLKYALDELLAGRGDVRLLKGVPGQPVVRLLENRLRQAVASEQRTRRLIRELDDDRFAVREKATLELIKLGADAEFALRQKLEAGASAEVRARARRVLSQIEKAGHQPIDPAWVRRALEILRKLDSAQARQTLEKLAQLDAETLVGQEARRQVKPGPRR